MSDLRLPDRPRGSRRHWKKVSPDLAECGAKIRRQVRLELVEKLRDPVEAQEFYHRTRLKRIEARYANGKHVSLVWHTNGSVTFRIRGLS